MTDAMLLDPPFLPLWRAPGVLQLGADGQLVLNEVPPGLDDAITLLAHPQTRDSLTRLLPALESTWIDWLLTELAERGAIRPVEQSQPTEIAVVGSGETAARLADALSEAGLQPALRPTQGTERALVPGHALRRSWATAWPTLAVLATQTVEPDRTLTDELVHAGIPHLVVRVEPTRATVGPFVIPGHSGCVRCHDLTRSHNDQAWPRLLAQLCRATPKPPGPLRDWAIATAVLQVRAHLADGAPDTLSRMLQINLRDPALHSLGVPMHPNCHCQITAFEDEEADA